jgi:hypothetical protein
MVDITSHSVPEEYIRMLLVMHAAGAVAWSVFQAPAAWPVVLFLAVAVRGLGPLASGFWRRGITAGLMTALVATTIGMRSSDEIRIMSAVLSVFLAVKLIAENGKTDSAAGQRG